MCEKLFLPVIAAADDYHYLVKEKKEAVSKKAAGHII